MLKPFVMSIKLCALAFPVFVLHAHAAEKEVTHPDVKALLGAIKNYAPGHSRKPLVAVEKMVSNPTRSPAMQKRLAATLAEMLASHVSLDCKYFLCKQLSLIGSDKEVDMLVSLIEDDALSLAARSALERIPG